MLVLPFPVRKSVLLLRAGYVMIVLYLVILILSLLVLQTGLLRGTVKVKEV